MCSPYLVQNALKSLKFTPKVQAQYKNNGYSNILVPVTHITVYHSALVVRLVNSCMSVVTGKGYNTVVHLHR